MKPKILKYINRWLLLMAAFLVVNVIFNSCTENKEIDTDKPTIDFEYANAFPSYCDTIYFGEDINLKAFFTDNVELGAFSIDIHNNFDHHTHAYKIENCNLAPVKQAVNPFTLIEDFDIPAGREEHEANQIISIPTGSDLGLFDEGDYCFHIYLTDKEGWSTPFAVSIKMMHRAE